MTAVSGRLLGTHQKIDRVARKHLEGLLPACYFPGIRAILHFEGNNGPDAIKRKSPAKDEPWHYIQPFDESDTQLIELIEHHYQALVKALKTKNGTRAAFEAAWLSHALVDGLTPAHHYPYEEKLVELRSGRGIETRTTIKAKLLMPGETRRHQVSNNWKMWGPKGLFTTHAAFEWGVATLMKPMKLAKAAPTKTDIEALQTMGLGTWFRHYAQDVARLELYDRFYARGWTTSLAREVRKQLAPSLVRAVSLVWYAALVDAGLAQEVA